MNITHHSTGAVENGLKPTSISRDLRAIAELISICFADRLDDSGRAAVREMKLIASLRPLLWLFGALDAAKMGMGYVWLADGRVVGNVSTFRAHAGAGSLTSGWIVANVAVHPNQRRQGIARTLVEAAMEFIARRGGPWGLLQVEDDNSVAIELYESLGFEEIGRVTQWEYKGERPFKQVPIAVAPVPRLRRASEWRDEMELARRDRSIGLSWAKAFDTADFREKGALKMLGLLTGKRRRRWSLDDGLQLIGSLWVDSNVAGGVRMTLLLDPEVNQMEVGLPLVAYAMNSTRTRKRIQLETSERDPAVHDALHQMGFRPLRKLIQMRWLSDS